MYTLNPVWDWVWLFAIFSSCSSSNPRVSVPLSLIPENVKENVPKTDLSKRDSFNTSSVGGWQLLKSFWAYIIQKVKVGTRIQRWHLTIHSVRMKTPREWHGWEYSFLFIDDGWWASNGPRRRRRNKLRIGPDAQKVITKSIMDDFGNGIKTLSGHLRAGKPGKSAYWWCEQILGSTNFFFACDSPRILLPTKVTSLADHPSGSCRPKSRHSFCFSCLLPLRTWDETWFPVFDKASTELTPLLVQY